MKDTRQKLGLTQSQLARLLGTSQHRVSEIEKGRDGRKMTKQQRYHLVALRLLHKHELIDELDSLL
jgi:transcriptional regulator with XRE-family HTH domain